MITCKSKIKKKEKKRKEKLANFHLVPVRVRYGPGSNFWQSSKLFGIKLVSFLAASRVHFSLVVSVWRVQAGSPRFSLFASQQESRRLSFSQHKTTFCWVRSSNSLWRRCLIETSLPCRFLFILSSVSPPGDGSIRRQEGGDLPQAGQRWLPLHAQGGQAVRQEVHQTAIFGHGGLGKGAQHRCQPAPVEGRTRHGREHWAIGGSCSVRPRHASRFFCEASLAPFSGDRGCPVEFRVGFVFCWKWNSSYALDFDRPVLLRAPGC